MARNNSLNARQAEFVRQYLLDLNATAAAIRAGYSENGAGQTAANLLKVPKVAAAVAAAKQARAEALGIDAAWVLREAVALYQRCISEIKPALHPKTRRQLRDDDGNPLFTFNAAVAARALELVGKHVDVGAFEERVQVRGEISLIERLQAGRDRVACKARVIDVEAQPAPALPKLVASRDTAATKRT